MARRWFLNSDSEIVGLSDNDDFPVPTDETAVLDSVIRAADPPGANGRIQSGGEWDGAAYTAPSGAGVLVPLDPDTELGRKQIAATTLHNWLHGTSAGVHAIRHEKPQIDVQRAEQFIAMAHWANYLVAHMATITIDLFEAWVTQMIVGASDVTSIQTYFEKAHLLDDSKVPLEACAWANPVDASAVILNLAREKSTQGTVNSGVTGTWFENEEPDLTMIDLGNGSWIRRLPGV